MRLFFGGQHSRRDVGLLPRLHGTAVLSMVMVSAGLLQGCGVGAVRPAFGLAAAKFGPGDARIGPGMATGGGMQ